MELQIHQQRCKGFAGSDRHVNDRCSATGNLVKAAIEAQAVQKQPIEDSADSVH